MVFQNITIDDRNTSAINYQGYWFNQGSYIATSANQTGTLSSSNDLNANFTVDTPPIFAFYYFGIKRSGGGFYQICIDCDPNNRSWLDIDGLNRTDDGKNPPVVLFSQQWTNPQPHEIIITNRPDTRFANNNSQITLDTLVYTIDDGTPAPSSTLSSTSSTSTNPSGLASQTSAPSGSSNNGTLVIATVPAVIGGILVFLLAIFFILRRRRRRALNDPSSFRSSMIETGNSAINFVPSSRTIGEDSQYQEASRIDPFVIQSTTEKGSDPVHASSSVTPVTQSTGPSSSANRREEDAGSIHGLSDYGDTLPPDYNDATRNRRRSNQET